MFARAGRSTLLFVMILLTMLACCATAVSGEGSGLREQSEILLRSHDAGMRLEEADLVWVPQSENSGSLFVPFRKQFTVDEPIVSAGVFGAADRGVTVYVNGTQLGFVKQKLLVSMNDYPGVRWMAGEYFDITELVREGQNTFGARVASTVVGGKSEGGLLAQIVLHGADGSVTRISSDGSFDVCGSNIFTTGWTLPPDMGGDDAGQTWVKASVYAPGWERIIAFGRRASGEVDYTLITSLWKDTGNVTTLDASEESTMDGFVTADGAKLMLNGKEYRAIGVNVPHLHSAYNGTWHHISQIYGNAENAKEAMVAAIIDAHRNKVAFIRFFANPGYPVDAEKLYFKDRDEYWRQMDEVFDLCRAHNIRLIPCLGVVSGWFYICGEPKQALLDPNSKTYNATYNYVEEFVTRYKDDPVVLMWELENEAFLAADVNMQGRSGLGAGQFPAGSPYVKPTLTLEDSLTFDMTLQVYKEWTSIIKSLDPNHLVTSGDAHVRDTSESLRRYFPGQVWILDSLDQHVANYIESQTEPLDVFSIHAYGPQPSARWPGHVSTTDYYTSLVRAAHSKPAPVFIGELGNGGPSFGEDPEAAWTRSFIDAMEQEGVSLMALWVWHFPWQPMNTLDGFSHPKLMQQVKEFNEKYAGY
ncbi:MAG: cellulase family glycosylhydrolase [Bacillota bacterium]